MRALLVEAVAEKMGSASRASSTPTSSMLLVTTEQC
jgi:hypothetical protein